MKHEVSILYKIGKINDLIIFIPVRILYGESNKEKNKFYDELSNQLYYNKEYIYSNLVDYIYDNEISIEELKKEYNSDDYLNIYFNKSLDNVYFGKYSSDDKDIVFSTLSKEEFENEYGIKLDYNLIDNNDNKFNNEPLKYEEPEIDPIKDIKKLSNTLKNKVLFQDGPIDELLLTLFNNYMLPNNKSNIIICGESGVGKTKTFDEIRKNFSLPISYINFNSIEYEQMQNLEIDVLCDLYSKANENLDLAQNGIVIIDGIDEDCVDDSTSKLIDIFYALKSILDRSCVSIKFVDSGEIISFDTSKLTFILSGRFKELINNTEKSINVPVEFFNKNSNITLEENYLIEDFSDTYYTDVKFFDYFDKVILFNSLTKDNIKQILLNSDDSPLVNYKESLNGQNILLNKIPNNVIEYICDKVYKNKMNCKGFTAEINNIFKNCLMDIMKTNYQNLELKIKNDIIYNPKNGYQLKKKK